MNDYKTEQSTENYEVKFEGIQVETLEGHYGYLGDMHTVLNIMKRKN